jgi:general secretion pathway protein I
VARQHGRIFRRGVATWIELAAVRGEAGFSLIEALIAMVILAVSAAALIGATEAYVGRIRGLEDRATAQWVAENALVELQLKSPDIVADNFNVTMLRRVWTVRIGREAIADPDMARVLIQVSENGQDDPLVRFGGFVEQSAKTP